MTKKMTNIDAVNRHYEASKKAYLKNGSSAEAHIAYYREKHPENYRALYLNALGEDTGPDVNRRLS